MNLIVLIGSGAVGLEETRRRIGLKTRRQREI